MKIDGNTVKLEYGTFECFAYYWGELAWDCCFKFKEVSEQKDTTSLEDAFVWYESLINEHVKGLKK